MARFRYYFERSRRMLRKNKNIITKSDANITAFFKFLYISKFSINDILNANKLSSLTKSLK